MPKDTFRRKNLPKLTVFAVSRLEMAAPARRLGGLVHDSVAVCVPMSVFGPITSASPPGADIPGPTLDFRF